MKHTALILGLAVAMLASTSFISVADDDDSAEYHPNATTESTDEADKQMAELEGTPEQQQKEEAEVQKNIHELLPLVNQERANNGLQPLVLDDQLCGAARLRSIEIAIQFSHERVDGTDCFTVLKEVGASYTACGENIAQGQTDAATVMNTWMNSDVHRANILNPNFHKIGLGYYHTKNCWVQLFTD